MAGVEVADGGGEPVAADGLELIEDAVEVEQVLGLAGGGFVEQGDLGGDDRDGKLAAGDPAVQRHGDGRVAGVDPVAGGAFLEQDGELVAAIDLQFELVDEHEELASAGGQAAAAAGDGELGMGQEIAQGHLVVAEDGDLDAAVVAGGLAEPEVDGPAAGDAPRAVEGVHDRGRVEGGLETGELHGEQVYEGMRNEQIAGGQRSGDWRIMDVSMESEFRVPAAVYDAMVDWPKRLANEEAFYRWAFGRVGAKRVLDAACGTGRHAEMFANWGLEVDGADLSEEMIAIALQRTALMAEFTGAKRPGFAVRSFAEAAGAVFDVVVCTGNSLPLAGSEEQCAKAVKAMAKAVRPGGMLILHALNMAGRDEGPVKWDKCKRASINNEECLLLKGTHRAGGYGFVELLLVRPGDELHSQTARFLALKASQVVEWCRAAGCKDVELYGNWKREAFDAKKSGDLIVVAMR